MSRCCCSARTGKVRGNADFFYYNNPAATDGSVQLLGAAVTENGSEDRIRLDLAALPQDIDRVTIAASRYRRAHFGELENIRLVVTDASGEAMLGFSIADAGTESAFVFGEVYRRAEAWKFRAIWAGARLRARRARHCLRHRDRRGRRPGRRAGRVAGLPRGRGRRRHRRPGHREGGPRRRRGRSPRHAARRADR